MEKNSGWTTGGLIGAGVAVGLIFLGCMFYTGVSQYLGQTRVVTVKGLAEREVPADQVIWPITFKETTTFSPRIRRLRRTARKWWRS